MQFVNFDSACLRSTMQSNFGACDNNPAQLHAVSHHQHLNHHHQLPLATQPIRTVIPPPVKTCKNCGRSQTPIWRKSPCGQVLCNACGLYLKQQGKMRPIDLDTKPPQRKSSNASQMNPHNSKRKDSGDDSSSNDLPFDAKKSVKCKKPRQIKIAPLPIPQLTGSNFHNFGNDYAHNFGSNQSIVSRGPTAIVHKGERYEVGNVVSVRGVEHPEYIGIVLGFEMRNSEKFFWMRWLIPKPEVEELSRNDDGQVDLNDFTPCIPDVVTCETIDAVQYVYNTVPSSLKHSPVGHPASFKPIHPQQTSGSAGFNSIKTSTSTSPVSPSALEQEAAMTNYFSKFPVVPFFHRNASAVSSNQTSASVSPVGDSHPHASDGSKYPGLVFNLPLFHKSKIHRKSSD
ncbi:hypothetical protein MP228_008330 [Amoeboaphelidium protococcarum]|nr:hypothetical protein MP228_008330 [Amoeboaphelidium protococcarum]